MNRLGIVFLAFAFGALPASGFAADNAAKGPPAPLPLAKGDRELPEMVLYKNHGYNPDQGIWVVNMGYSYIGDEWNDTVSSLVVVRGSWKVCRDPNFANCRSIGPGAYDLRDWPGWDNTISSIQIVSY
jgi:hypothetical protein